MIAYLKGVLVDFSDRHVLVATPGGVGYEAACPTSVLASLPARGEELELYVHTVVGEKAIDLYGFGSLDERELFRALISIDKLGPKKAVAILSSFSPDRLREIALREDERALATVPGIGPKSAKQILWFLKDKVEHLGAGGGGAARVETPSGRAASQFLDALAALRNLGYSEEEARAEVRPLFDEDPDLDAATAIRAALKALAQNR
ncbi:MAG: Holliday junction branch migration protein RuvA [Desulfovibrionaceae bacterium]